MLLEIDKSTLHYLQKKRKPKQEGIQIKRYMKLWPSRNEREKKTNNKESKSEAKKLPYQPPKRPQFEELPRYL